MSILFADCYYVTLIKLHHTKDTLLSLIKLRCCLPKEEEQVFLADKDSQIFQNITFRMRFKSTRVIHIGPDRPRATINAKVTDVFDAVVSIIRLLRCPPSTGLE